MSKSSLQRAAPDGCAPFAPRLPRFPLVRWLLAATSLLAVLAAAPAAAQDRFGAAVAVDGRELLILKPDATRGAATVWRYAPDGQEGWRPVAPIRVAPIDAAGPGEVEAVDGSEGTEAFGPSMSLAGDHLLVAAGVPDPARAAYAFRRSARAEAGWTSTGPYDLGTAADGVPDGRGAAGAQAAPGAATLDDVMRIMQPPRRVVSADGELAAVAVLGRMPIADVRVLRRDQEGKWREEARLSPPDRGSGDERAASEGERSRGAGFPTELRFGAALALAGDRLLVGAPAAGGGPGAADAEGAGRAYVYARDPASGTWRHEVTLTPGPAEDAAGSFGAAVAWDADGVLVSAPGVRGGPPGAVHAFRREEGTAAWSPEGRIVPEEGAPGDGFGTALAVRNDELLVGAPGADEGAGRVYRFVARGEEGARPPTAGEKGALRWKPAGTVAVTAAEPGAGFGSAVALGEEVAAVGAPAARGGVGAAVAFRREGDGWSVGTWLRPAAGPEAVVGGEIRCEQGRAADFSCEGVDLLAFLPLEVLGEEPGGRASDLWGWTDPETGREIALAGTIGGVTAVDVTEPASPVPLARLEAPPSGARDIKVYRDHAFVTGDGSPGHGLRVYDLGRLRDLPASGSAAPSTGDGGAAEDDVGPGDGGAPTVGGQAPDLPILAPDTIYRGIESAHNLVIDTESGFAYTVGGSGGGETCGGGLHMVDIREPRAPSFAGCWSDPTTGLIWPGRIHDAQCTVYRGPDEEHRGRQLCFASIETALAIVDVTDKEDPVVLAQASYPRLAYVHQGWLSEDHRYFYLDDELDELVGFADRTRTMVWDVADLDDPVLVGEYLGTTGATDHNLYVKGDRMYQANYQAGMRVLDISEPESPREVGFFDTTPYPGDPPGFYGAWTAYPYFESGTVVVSSMGEGLFVLRPRDELVP